MTRRKRTHRFTETPPLSKYKDKGPVKATKIPSEDDVKMVGEAGNHSLAEDMREQRRRIGLPSGFRKES